MRALPLLALAVLACAKSEPAWSVFRDGREVLRYEEKPGPLVGTALPPPGSTPPRHPFLSGSALEASEEDALRRLLERSTTAEEFKRALESAGYVVRPRNAG